MTWLEKCGCCGNRHLETVPCPMTQPVSPEDARLEAAYEKWLRCSFNAGSKEAFEGGYNAAAATRLKDRGNG